jgi:hypothetical protein
MVRIHIRRPQGCVFQRLKDKRIPSKDAMVAKERMRPVGGEVFLAGREVLGNIELRPEPVCDGLRGAAPSLKLSGNVTFNV